MALTSPARAWRGRELGLAAWALWGVAILGVATVPWFDHLLRQARRPELTQLGASTVASVLAAVVAATTGAVLAGRRPATRWAGCCWPWGCW